MGDGLRLEAGHHLRVRLADGELRIEAALPDGREPYDRVGRSAAASASPQGAPVPETPGENVHRAMPEPARSDRPSVAPSAAETPHATWSRRVASGDYAGVLADAQAAGLEATLAQRPLADLAALSDASRYLERTDVARQALVAQRERFPSSPDAKGAAFLLGRISQDGGDARTAIAWFTRYLAEAPNGPFVAEALGRKLVASRKVDGALEAKALAREYLERFPNGAHAAVAREVARAR